MSLEDSTLLPSTNDPVGQASLSSESGTATIYDDTTNHQYIASLEKDRLENNPGAEKIVIDKIDFGTCEYL